MVAPQRRLASRESCRRQPTASCAWGPTSMQPTPGWPRPPRSKQHNPCGQSVAVWGGGGELDDGSRCSPAHASTCVCAWWYVYPRYVAGFDFCQSVRVRYSILAGPTALPTPLLWPCSTLSHPLTPSPHPPQTPHLSIVAPLMCLCRVDLTRPQAQNSPLSKL